MKTRIALSFLAASLVALPFEARAQDAQYTYRPPTVVPYEGGPIPPGATLERRTNWPLVIAGLSLTGTAYAGSLGYALSTCSAGQACRPGSEGLYVPIVGPFITMAKAPSTGGAALAGFAGAIQVTGAVLTVLGVAIPRTVVIIPARQGWSALRLEPMSVGSGSGVGLTITNL